MNDKVFPTLLLTMVISMVAFLLYVVPKSMERDDRARAIAEKMGCIYIGSARDLSSVKFLDCNGEVKLIRVEM